MSYHVYWLYGTENQLLYVGMSGQVQLRINDWRPTCFGDELAWWRISDPYLRKSDAATAERLAILRDGPLHNVQVWNPWRSGVRETAPSLWAVSEFLALRAQAGSITWREALEIAADAGMKPYNAAAAMGVKRDFVPRHQRPRLTINEILDYNNLM